MNIRLRNRPGTAFIAALVFACLVTLVSSATAATVATGSFQIGSAGETASIPIVLDSAPGGLSGYQITVSLSNPSVATITAVAFPGWATLNSASELPSGQVLLKAVDLSQQVPAGGTNVVLATITVRGSAVGSTNIGITPDAALGVQDQSGNPYSVTTPAGTVTVGTPSGVVPTANPTVVPTGGVVPPVYVPTPITTGVVPVETLPAGIPTSGPSVVPIGTVVPIATSVPGVITTGGSTVITNPPAVAPGGRTTVIGGKRYAIGNPGSFIGTRFGSGGTGDNTTTRRTVTGGETTLKPGSRAYGINPPASRFVRWYPEARWKAGIR